MATETEELRRRIMEVLEYDPETGLFRWRNGGKGRRGRGWFAGTKTHKGYIKIMVFGVTYEGHRLAWLIMTGHFPKLKTDHKNGVKTDNRWNNLRDVSTLENARNQSKSKANTSGHTGVRYYARYGRWRAEIKVNYSNLHLGLFETLEEAVAARKEGERKYGFHENHGRPK